MKIISTNIGDRKEINWKGKIIKTGIFKFPVNVPIFLDAEKVKNDALKVIDSIDLKTSKTKGQTH